MAAGVHARGGLARAPLLLLARDARDRLTVYGVLQHPFCAEDVNLAINTSRVSRLQSADFDQALNLLDDDE